MGNKSHKNSGCHLNVRQWPGDVDITRQSKKQLTSICTIVSSSVRGGGVGGDGGLVGSKTGLSRVEMMGQVQRVSSVESPGCLAVCKTTILCTPLP